MLISYKRGQSSIVVRVKIRDSTVSTGAGKTGLAYNTSGLIISTIANNESAATAYTVAGSTIEDITTLGTYAAPTSTKCRFKEVDSTNHKGVYEIQIADARFAVSSAKALLISISGATGAAECDVCIPLTDLDPYDATRAGLTALPNAAAAASGGLIINGSNSGTVTLAAFTVTGTLTISDGIVVTRSTSNATAITITGNGTGHGVSISSGSGATGNGLSISSSATNGSAVVLAGAGTGDGFKATGGATGHAVELIGGATSGNAVKATATNGNSYAILVTGQGTGAGLRIVAGSGANGVEIVGGSSSGDGISITCTSGDGIDVSGGTAGDGIKITGGASGNGLYALGGASSGDGFRAEAQGTGDGIDAVGLGSGGVGIKATGGTNAAGMVATGAGTGNGFTITGGATGNGLSATGGATSGDGARFIAATAGDGMELIGAGGGVDFNASITTQDAAVATSVDDASPTASSFFAATGLSATDDYYNGMWLAFTSGVNQGHHRKISDYTGSTRRFQFTSAGSYDTPFLSAPADTDTFIIYGKAPT